MNWLEKITQNLTWWTLLDAYFIWIVAVFLLKFVLVNKRILEMTIFFLFIGILYGIAFWLDLPMANDVYQYIFLLGPLLIVIIGAPNIRLTLESLWKGSQRSNSAAMGNERTKTQITRAVLALSKQSIGALITIEKHNTLDQYSQKAITLNSDVSTELLINIFTPNTPLHDGAVIVRGDKILCAGAYFVLSSNESFDKTTGSRHRAALGISEITDSMTIIVSEETGSISIAINGVMTKIKDLDTLTEYLNLFLK